MTDMEKVNEASYSHLIYPQRYPSMRSKKPGKHPIPSEKEAPEILDEGYRVGVAGSVAKWLAQRVTQADHSLRICLTSISQLILSPNTYARLLLITTTKILNTNSFAKSQSKHHCHLHSTYSQPIIRALCHDRDREAEDLRAERE